MSNALKLDVNSTRFAVASEPRPVTDYETKERKVTDNGEPLWSLNLLATASDEISIISVKVPGPVDGLVVNESVKVNNLVARVWTNNGKAAIAYSAERIESLAKSKAVA